jgi:hypothetical protein
MARSPRQRERSDKAEADAQKPMTKAEAVEAMGRFKTLTRQLLGVTREQLKDEEDRYQSGKPKRKRRRRRGQ